jgi:hypothetical protein
MTTPALVPLSAALLLEMAADALSTTGWCRPSRVVDELQLGLHRDMVTPWRGRTDPLAAARLTLLGALHTASTVDASCWADLSRARLRPLWDALVLAVGAFAGVWDGPTTGQAQIESVLRWERDAGAHGDVVGVLHLAAQFARAGTATTDCPWCACDPRPGENARGDTCELCHGTATISLHPRRWMPRLVPITTTEDL